MPAGKTRFGRRSFRRILQGSGRSSSGSAKFAAKGKVELFACIDGGNEKSAKFDNRRRARISFGSIDAGKHRVSVRVADGDGRTIASNTYAITVKPQLLGGPAGKKLNNFVTRLHVGKLANGTVRFFCPKDTAATLVFSDWEPGKHPQAGTRRVLNYVIFRPYYNEGENDVEFLRSVFAK